MSINVSHAQGELLAQVRPAGVVAVTLYTSQQLRTEITYIAISLIEGATGPIAVQIYHDDDGVTFDDDSIIANINRAQNDPLSGAFQAQHPGSGIMIKPGGSLGVKVDSAGDVNFTVYGHTEVLAERVRSLT